MWGIMLAFVLNVNMLLIQVVFDGVQLLFVNADNTTRCVTSSVGHYVGFCIGDAPLMPVPSLLLVRVQ